MFMRIKGTIYLYFACTEMFSSFLLIKLDSSYLFPHVLDYNTYNKNLKWAFSVVFKEF